MFRKPLSYKNGATYYQHELNNYFIDFCPGTQNTLFVTFENAAPPLVRPDGDRYPWSYAFLHREGFPILGIKPKQVDWYRGMDIHHFFRSHELAQFLKSFDRVIFYGSSMGGYAALAFAEIFPGCDVIAHNPQSTLHPELAPWENRFPIGSRQDWTGDFNDAAISCYAARKVFVSYDPFDRQDRMHIERLLTNNLIELKVPLVGHSIPEWLLRMGVLKDIVHGMVDDTLDNAACRAMARKRRDIGRYYLMMGLRARNPKVAQASMEKAVETQPGDARLHYQISEILCNKRDFLGALSHIERAIEISPRVAHYCAYKAVVLQKLNRLEEAELLGRHALQLDPNNALAHRTLSRTLWMLGEREESLALARSAVELEPNNAHALHFLASSLMEARAWEEAADVERRAIALVPGNPDYQTLLARCLLKRGDRKEAMKVVKAGMKSHPHHRGLAALAEDMESAVAA